MSSEPLILLNMFSVTRPSRTDAIQRMIIAAMQMTTPMPPKVTPATRSNDLGERIVDGSEVTLDQVFSATAAGCDGDAG